jgi:hypothetical protein
VAVSADGKRNVVACTKDCASLIETCDLESASREIVDGTFSCPTFVRDAKSR